MKRILPLLVAWLGQEVVLVRRRPRFVLALLVLPVLVLPLLLLLALHLRESTGAQGHVRVGLHGRGAQLERATRSLPHVTWANGGDEAALRAGEFDALLSVPSTGTGLELAYVAERPSSVHAMLLLRTALAREGVACVATTDARHEPRTLVVLAGPQPTRGGETTLLGLFALLAALAVVALAVIEVHTRDTKLRLSETIGTLPVTAELQQRLRLLSIVAIAGCAVAGFAAASLLLQQFLLASDQRIPGALLVRTLGCVGVAAFSASALLHGLVVRLRGAAATEAWTLLLVPLLAGAFAFGAMRLPLAAELAALVPFAGPGRLVALEAQVPWTALLLQLIPALALGTWALRSPAAPRQDADARESLPATLWLLVAGTWVLGFALGGAGAELDLRLRVTLTLLVGLLVPASIYACRHGVPELGVPTFQRCSTWIHVGAGTALVVGIGPVLAHLTERTLGALPAVRVPSTWDAVLLLALLPAIVEEFVFRGVLLQSFLRAGVRHAVLLTAVLFALHHYHVLRLPGSFAAGLVFGLIARRSGSWVAAAVAHACVNVAGLLELGGRLGPVQGAALAAIAFAVLLFARPREGVALLRGVPVS